LMSLERLIRNGPIGAARRGTGTPARVIRQRGRGGPTNPTAGPLAGRHVLLVAGCGAEAEGPGVNALAVHVEQAAGRVSILPSASVIADLLGRRVVGRPDLIVAMLPGRGASMAAVRVAERLGVPLLAVVNSGAAPSWGEVSTLRRATRIAVTSERLRERVMAAGVTRDKVELWPALLPSAFTVFDEIVGRTLGAALTSPGIGAR
jgi:hypothetical protein